MVRTGRAANRRSACRRKEERWRRDQGGGVQRLARHVSRGFRLSVKRNRRSGKGGWIRPQPIQQNSTRTQRLRSDLLQTRRFWGELHFLVGPGQGLAELG